MSYTTTFAVVVLGCISLAQLSVRQPQKGTLPESPISDPFAVFLVNGDVCLLDDGKIDNYSWFLPDAGPDIVIYSCGSIRMYDRSRIRSHGDQKGGTIGLCAGEDILLDGIAGIECNGFDLPEGTEGGAVFCQAGNDFRMTGILTYITVEAVDAGIVDIDTCGTGDRSIDVRGRILADGTDPGGIGGEIHLDARNGGIWLPGIDHCLATGEGADGIIVLAYRTVLGPLHAPDVAPDPILIPDGPDNGPCDCQGGIGN